MVEPNLLKHMRKSSNHPTKGKCLKPPSRFACSTADAVAIANAVATTSFLMMIFFFVPLPLAVALVAAVPALKIFKLFV